MTRNGGWRLRMGCLLAALQIFALTVDTARAAELPRKPNILLIVADDLGYTDLGEFGSEIRTPNLDRLAREGLRLVNFHATPVCSTTRATLLTGTDHHIAGVGAMYVDQFTRGKPGYEGFLSDRVSTLPELLRLAGYQTYMAGKWHLGSGPKQLPVARGFDRSFALLDGAASHWAKAWFTGPTPTANYRDGQAEVVDLPPDFYSTSHFTQRIRSYIDEGLSNNKPFFAYLALTAPHWPLQAPEEIVDRYRKTYDQGYDVLRAKRIRSAIEKGVLPRSTSAAPARLVATARPWAELGVDDRRASSRRMEIYAAMVDVMDREIGGLLGDLQKSGELANTIVIFMSDNGAEGYSREDQAVARSNPAFKQIDNSEENFGRQGSLLSYGPGWAAASSAVFRLFKEFPTEGGTRVPALIWDGRNKADGSIRNQFLTAADITPTILDFAGSLSSYGRFVDGSPLPVQGRSFTKLLQDPGAEIRERGSITASELHGHRAVHMDNWKILWLGAERGGELGAYRAENRWSLYDLKRDPAETNDLAVREPRVVRELAQAWEDFARKVGVVAVPVTEPPVSSRVSGRKRP